MTTRLITTVKWYSTQKGFGFLLNANGGQDIFVHASGLETNDPLKDGQKVSYELDTDRQGRSIAVNVRQVA